MITVRTSPAYVNRVRQDWTANGGVYGDGGVYAVVPSNDPFAQLGPTLDLTFAGVPTNQLTAATVDGYSINLNLSSEIYQIAAQYTVWTATGLTQVNFADIVTFTRGSNATQFDSTGSLVYAPVNLLLRSEALATSPWFSSGLTSITNNTPNTVDPAGGNTATELVVAASAGIAGQGAVLSGVNHTGSVWLRCASGTVTGSLIIYLTASPFTNIGTQAITITTTWQRFSVTTSSLPTAGTSYNFQIHNLSGGTVYAWGAQLNPTPILGGITSSLTTYYPTTTTAYYGPRFDYNPSTLAAQGLLIEEQRTNLMLQSQFVSGWTASAGTLTTNVTASPDGTTNAASFIEDSTNAVRSINQSSQSFTAGATLTASLFVKQTGGATRHFRIQISTNAGVNGFRAYFNLATNSVALQTQGFGTGTAVANSATITPVGNGWYRISASGTVDPAATVASGMGFMQDTPSGAATYTGDGTSGLFLWGAQLEAGAFPTSYIPTTVAQVTRNADVASVNTLSPWLNQAEGTLFAEFTARLGVTQTPATFSGVGGIGYRVRKSGTNQYYAALRDGGSVKDIAITPSPALTEGQVIKVAVGVKLNDCALSGGGQTAVTQPAFSPMPTITDVNLGFTGTDGFALNGWFRRFTYYPRRLSNADLQTITA